jgi:phosphohistidine phosphatase
MKLYLVHHGEAVGPEVDPQRPLSADGAAAMARIARKIARCGAKPAVVWHSGKLRAKQTAEAFWRECNALAELAATRDLQPDDQPTFMRDRLRHEPRDVMLIGHFPHLPRLLALLVSDEHSSFPAHGVVALETSDDGETWKELWRAERDDTQQ